MRVSPKALEEFKVIYKEQFGVDLSDADALEKATQVLTMMNAVYRPITKADLEAAKKRQVELLADSES